MNKRAFSKIWIIIIIIVLVAGGILGWQYFKVTKEEVEISEEKGKKEEVIEKETEVVDRKKALENKILANYGEDAPCWIDSWSPDEKYLVIDCGTSPIRSKDVYDVLTEKKIINFVTYGEVNYCWFWLSNDEIVFCELSQPWEEAEVIGISIINLITGEKRVLKQATDVKKYRIEGVENDNILFSQTEVSSSDKWETEEKHTTYWIMDKNGKIIKQVFKESINWKTYKNEEYGYEVKYPPGWKNVIRDYPEHYTLVFGPIDFDFESNSLISILSKQSDLSLDEYYMAQKTISEYFNKEPILINGTQGIKANFKWGFFEGVDVFLKKGNYIYIFTLSFRPDRDKEKDTQIFNQMLSTFRFLE